MPVPRLLWSTLIGRAGVRDYFQSLFLAFNVAFLMLAAYQAWRDWPMIVGWISARR
jgi:hypothetical protein